jgi:hypothetical protein
MIEISQEKIVGLGNAIEDLEDQKKALTSEIGQFFDDFLEENHLEKKVKKQLKSSVKKYLKWKKDSAKFNLEETLENEFLDILTGEKVVEKISEEEARTV